MELEDQDIDEDLHCRQILAYGRKTMRLLMASNVLVSGMQGLGAEIAKNLILTGLKSVTLHDEGTVELWDLSGSFFLSESDVGKNRAEASYQKLQELSDEVLVTVLPWKLTNEQLSNFQAVVFTASDLKTAMEFNDFCHNHTPPIPFIKADVNGLFGNVFCDFGPEFTVNDVDGEEPHSGIIKDINTNSSHAVVHCVNDEKLKFQDGDFVVFSEICGMKELNDGKPRKIKLCTPYSFVIEEEEADFNEFGKYEKGGIVTQVKQPKVLNFKSLRETLDNPKEFLLSDFSKPDHPRILHLAFKALDEFISQMKRFPVAGSKDDAHELISIAETINKNSGSDWKLEDIKPELLCDFAHGARAVLSPMATMFGGIAAQEVIKACSGMFYPIFQLFYFDSIESLPKTQPKPKYRRPLNSRYDAQISVFGSQFQKKLQETHTFIVGCGSLGCEFVKNLALMGVSCGTKEQTLRVADDHVIKKNNLSTGVLFSKNRIGLSKNVNAACAAALVNPEFSVSSFVKRVEPKTQNVFDIAFWEKLEVVISAVDNIDTRMYVDRRCVQFMKPHLVSGTMGAKCSTQMVIPKVTENYGASKDHLEKEVCESTLKYFPYNIHHCVTWAMTEFEELLDTPVHDVNAYLEYPISYETAIRNSGDSKTLEIILQWLDMDRSYIFLDCIKWALLKFKYYFTHKVKEMVVENPEGLKTISGAPFWSPPKRFPHPLEFTLSDPSHVCFVLAGSILRAEVYHIPLPDWAKDYEQMDEAVGILTNIIHHLKLNERVSITNDKNHELSMDELFEKLEQCRMSFPTGFTLKPLHFDKDENSNYHIDFIAGLANMRARNYNIPEIDKLATKAIAGRIIPKIATCTSVAAGLVCLELYKVVDEDHQDTEDYRNTFANLALPFFTMARPLPSKVYNQQDMRRRWTTWDFWTIPNNPTMGEVINWFADEKGLHAYQVTYEDCLLYKASLGNAEHLKTKKVVDLVIYKAKVEFKQYDYYFAVKVACLDDAKKAVDVPPVYVNFRHRSYSEI